MENKCICFTMIKMGEKKWMEDLLNNGDIYMNSTAYFMKSSNKEIGDIYEGAEIINSGRVTKRRNDIDKEKLFCMWQLNNQKPADFAKIYYNEETNETIAHFDFRQYAGFSHDLYLVVIHNVKVFNQRFESACNNLGLKYDYRIVGYYDETRDEIRDITPFMKRSKYIHQNEIRYKIIYDKSEPLKVSIGNISDIASLHCVNDGYITVVGTVK